MATISFRPGREPITEAAAVRSFLHDFGIDFEFLPPPEEAKELLAKEVLDSEEKSLVLGWVKKAYPQLQKKINFANQDLIVLHPQVPQLQEMLAKFDKTHTHTDDEVRYIVDGQGVFGFNFVGQKFLLTMNAGEYISVPKNTQHWFYLTESKRIKAVRYFEDMAGWVAHYTGESTDI